MSTVTTAPTARRARASTAAKASRIAVSPAKSRAARSGTPRRTAGGATTSVAAGAGRSHAPTGGPPATRAATDASATVVANTETQSSERQAGTTPTVLIRPRVGF